MVDFETDVIQASSKQPVVVDFWAEWCQPCKILGPVLEQLEAESAGAWRLVKINTDLAPEIAQASGIMSIPAVKLYVDGEITADFTGAMPKSRVAQWLQDNLPSEFKDQLKRAHALLRDGRDTDAQSLLAQLHDLDPDHAKVRAMLARALGFTDPQRASDLVAPLGIGSEFGDLVEAIRTLARVDQLDPEDLHQSAARAATAQAIKALRAQRIEDAIEHWIDALVRDRSYLDELPRRAIIAIFAVLGREHELVKRWRKRFEMAMF